MIIEPYLNTFIFKHVSIPVHKLDFIVGELNDFIVWAVHYRNIPNIVFEGNK